MTRRALPILPPAAPGPEVDSFYHLANVDLSTCACQGLACFVARHRNQSNWNPATHPRIYCLGKCYAAPATGADDPPLPHIHVDAPQAIVLERLRHGGAPTLSAYQSSDGYQAARQALTRPPEVTLAAIDASALRGRGGAGFPTGAKWRAAAQAQSAHKYVVANADEGDPGAYIDRFLLEDDPHCLIEAMICAAYATGASKGFIYLRCEYPRARQRLESALAEARQGGILGPRVLNAPFAFDIELHIGQGSYLCGEETALLNSIEGRRPEATARPPYATERGLWGQPTVINNVETLANVPWILRHGPDAYRALGFSRSRGTKVVSLNSLFRRPGLYEVEFGIPLRRIVEDLGGGLATGPLHGLIIGGPLAGVIPPHLLDTPFAFEELRAIRASVGHGGVVAFDHHTSLAQLVHHVFAFGAFESCGKCLPCRLGGRRVEQIFAHACTARHFSQNDVAEFTDIAATLHRTSLCGHGGGLGEFAQSILRHYPHELDALVPRHAEAPCPA